eukprot:3796396-Prymnesium_polylepis.1
MSLEAKASRHRDRAQHSHRYDGRATALIAAQSVHQSTLKKQQSHLLLPNGSLEHPGNGAGDRTRALLVLRVRGSTVGRSGTL